MSLCHENVDIAGSFQTVLKGMHRRHLLDKLLVAARHQDLACMN